MIVIWILVLVPNWKIVKRTGISPWWSLIMFIPVVNLIALWRFAYMDWPAVKE